MGGGGGGVPLSRTFSTELVHVHEAGDACAQNNKKGGSAEPKEPPLDPPLQSVVGTQGSSFYGCSLLLPFTCYLIVVVYTYYSVYLCVYVGSYLIVVVYTYYSVYLCVYVGSLLIVFLVPRICWLFKCTYVNTTHTHFIFQHRSGQV